MQSISPGTIFRGNYAWEKSLPQIAKLTKNPLVLGRGIHTKSLRNKILIDLKTQNLNVNSANLKFDQEMNIYLSSFYIFCLADLYYTQS